MTNNTNQKRQPKGTENGGQFATSCNSESTVELDDGGLTNVEIDGVVVAGFRHIDASHHSESLDAGVEAASKFSGPQLAALVQRDESLREKSDEELEHFAEDAISNFDNWLDKKADEGEDWNEWSLADAASFMETFESMIRVRKAALLEDVKRAVEAKSSRES